MRLLLEVRRIIDGFVFDFSSCIQKAVRLIRYSTDKNRLLLFLVIVAVVLITISVSEGEVVFFQNLGRVMLASIASFFIFCLSENFWSLIKKSWLYNYVISNKKTITTLIKKMHESEVRDGEGGYLEARILLIAISNSEGFRDEEWRNALEISLFMLFLFFIFPSLLLFNFILFLGMYVYIFLWDQESTNQVYRDIYTLILLIHSMHQEDAKRCKKFILENKNQEVQALKKLYEATMKHY